MRKLSVFFFPALVFFVSFSFAEAVTFTITNPLISTNLEEMMDRIGSWIFTIAIGVLPIMILVGAFMLVTAAGDPKKITTGKKIIFFAVIGFTMVMLTRGIIALIRLVFGM